MEVFKSFYSQLTAVLPMDNLSEFDSRGLLPGNHKNKIKLLTTLPEKAEYFLDNVIRPGLEIGYDQQFKHMLKLMENSDDSKLKHLAESIDTALISASASRDNLATIQENTNYPSALMKYSTSDINSAYHKLVSEITDIIQAKSFKKMRRACYAEIRAVDSTLPESLIGKLERTKSADDMLDTLAKSPYWNWFDTRLLQAIVSASGSTEAETMLEKFKQQHYARRVIEILPYVAVEPLKDSVIFTEKFDKQLHELTFLDIVKHKHILEYDVLDIGEKKLVLRSIKTGCVELKWQVPTELVYQAYTSMKKKHKKLPSLAIKSLMCKEADEFVGLPFLWHGQEVNGIGPIEPLPEHVRREPYSLQQGFQWVTFSSSDVEIISKFCFKQLSSDRYSPGQTYMAFSHPAAKSDWRFGIRTTNGNKLAATVLAYPVCLSIRGVSVQFVYPIITCHRKYRNSRLWYILVKELVRRINISNINQVIFSGISSIIKEVASIKTWEYHFIHYEFPDSPTTPGWRKMTPEDVPSALALVKKYLSKFEVGQVFNTEDFTHCFLRPAASKTFVHTYVVENTSGIVTDLVSAVIAPSRSGVMIALITIVAAMRSPVKQLIKDIMVCARNNGAISIRVEQLDMRSDILESLSFKQSFKSPTFNFYNYKYPEITSDKFYFIDV